MKKLIKPRKRFRYKTTVDNYKMIIDNYKTPDDNKTYVLTPNISTIIHVAREKIDFNEIEAYDIITPRNLLQDFNEKN